MERARLSKSRGARIASRWLAHEVQREKKAMLRLRRGEALYGVIFLHRIEDETPASALDRYKRRLIRQGLALLRSGERTKSASSVSAGSPSR